MKIWRAFRGTAVWAALITAALWISAVVLSLLPMNDQPASGEEGLPALSPKIGEQVTLVVAVLITFVTVLTVLVVVSHLRHRMSNAQPEDNRPRVVG